MLKLPASLNRPEGRLQKRQGAIFTALSKKTEKTAKLLRCSVSDFFARL
jgi:hypothetical protein